MPQVCTVCASEGAKEIDLALVRCKESKRSIAKRFNVSHAAILRHTHEHLPETLARAWEVKRENEALEVMAEIERCVSLTHKMLAACDGWLTDPEDPTKYTLDARAEELMIVYSEPNGDGRLHRKRAPLSKLIIKAEGQKSRVVEGFETKRADPRELLLKSVAQLRPLAELLARLEGKLKDGPNINVLINPQYLQIRAVITAALAPYPEARAALAIALQEIEANGGDS